MYTHIFIYIKKVRFLCGIHNESFIRLGKGEREIRFETMGLEKHHSQSCGLRRVGERYEL